MAIYRGTGGAGDSTTDATVTEVTQQAVNAATSATQAAASATTASTKASEASTSATTASTKASEASTSATAAQTAQTATEAIKDSIDAFYLGTSTTNPTVDLNGDAVTEGDWYFNTTDNTTRIYDGTNWNTVNPDLVGDTTPQLGGNLDGNTYNITNVSSITATTVTADLIGDVTGDVTGTVSDVSNHDTDDISEGSTNLYYTDTRWDTRLGTKDTDDLSEGSTNLYYTTTRANTAIDARVDKTFVDNLNVDADTLDGLNSTDFERTGEALALAIALG